MKYTREQLGKIAEQQHKLKLKRIAKLIPVKIINGYYIVESKMNFEDV